MNLQSVGLNWQEAALPFLEDSEAWELCVKAGELPGHADRSILTQIHVRAGPQLLSSQGEACFPFSSQTPGQERQAPASSSIDGHVCLSVIGTMSLNGF